MKKSAGKGGGEDNRDTSRDPLSSSKSLRGLRIENDRSEMVQKYFR